MQKTVVVGMSGGVDSSVAAYLLKKEGYRVLGLFMKNWEEEGTVCTAAQDWQDVVSVCSRLEIPFYGVNFAAEYRERVFSYFLTESKAGRTPNPDILCNREIKFDALFKKAKELGADYLATGHYARTNEKGELLRGLDAQKDQSYFLYAVKSDILKEVLFPVGALPKSEVRHLAQEAGLSTATKKDSTGICFIGERNFRQFLSQFIPFEPGPIMTVEGKKIGEHVGLPFYTVGQRKGMGIGGQEGSMSEPWFVVHKEMATNTLVVAQGTNHPALYASELAVQELTWVAQKPVLPLQCTAKIRYRQADQACLVDSQLNVRFEVPQRAITPGQSIVFYDNETCMGGGIITSVR